MINLGKKTHKKIHRTVDISCNIPAEFRLWLRCRVGGGVSINTAVWLTRHSLSLSFCDDLQEVTHQGYIYFSPSGHIIGIGIMAGCGY